MNQFKEPPSGRNARKPSITPKLKPLPPVPPYRKVYSAPGYDHLHIRCVRQRRHLLQMWRNRLFFPLTTRTGGIRTSSPASSLYSGLYVFCSPALHLYAKYGKSYFLYAFQLGTQKVIDTLPRFVSVIATIFTDGVSVFMVGDSN